VLAAAVGTIGEPARATPFVLPAGNRVEVSAAWAVPRGGGGEERYIVWGRHFFGDPLNPLVDSSSIVVAEATCGVRGMGERYPEWFFPPFQGQSPRWTCADGTDATWVRFEWDPPQSGFTVSDDLSRAELHVVQYDGSVLDVVWRGGPTSTLASDASFGLLPCWAAVWTDRAASALTRGSLFAQQLPRRALRAADLLKGVQADGVVC
jgi:hypothetical protein